MASLVGDLVSIKNEIRHGLISTFVLHCKMCNVTHSVINENLTNKIFNANAAAVNGSISIAVEHSQLTELTSALNIPPLSKKKYLQIHNDLVNIYHETAWSSMIEAGVEESKLARENGEVWSSSNHCRCGWRLVQAIVQNELRCQLRCSSNYRLPH